MVLKHGGDRLSLSYVGGRGGLTYNHIKMEFKYDPLFYVDHQQWWEKSYQRMKLYIKMRQYLINRVLLVIQNKCFIEVF